MWPLAARAQQPSKLPTVGFLGANPPRRPGAHGQVPSSSDCVSSEPRRTAAHFSDGDRSPFAAWSVHSDAERVHSEGRATRWLERREKGEQKARRRFPMGNFASRTYRSMTFSRSTQLANLQTLVRQESLYRNDRQRCCRSRTPAGRGATVAHAVWHLPVSPGGHPKNARLPGRCAI